MQRTLILAAALLIPLAMLAKPAAAKPFEPEFTIIQVTGEVRVEVDGAEPAPAQVGESYAYGTTVETLRNSTAVLRLSEKNICRVAARTRIRVGEQMQNSKVKIIDLQTGKIDLELDEMVSGESVHIETAASVCGITGTKVSAESSREKDVNATVFTVREGKVWVNGQYFRIEELLDNSEIVVSTTDQGDYLRLRVVQGEMFIVLRDDEGEKQIEINGGDLVKIFARTSEDGKFLQVTMLIYDGGEEGQTLRQTLQYTIPIEDAPDPGDGGDDEEGDPTTTTTQPEGGPGFEPPQTTTTTVTTTTTTAPSVTPVGLR